MTPTIKSSIRSAQISKNVTKYISTGPSQSFSEYIIPVQPSNVQISKSVIIVSQKLSKDTKSKPSSNLITLPARSNGSSRRELTHVASTLCLHLKSSSSSWPNMTQFRPLASIVLQSGSKPSGFSSVSLSSSSRHWYSTGGSASTLSAHCNPQLKPSGAQYSSVYSIFVSLNGLM